jgi:hypothetical protein
MHDRQEQTGYRSLAVVCHARCGSENYGFRVIRAGFANYQEFETVRTQDGETANGSGPLRL